jgi:sterol desaturase/sphingolipid hydroxylase (fatty acid hydroxylase superfamily)
MNFFGDFFAALYTMPLEQAILLSLLGNVLMFAAALLVGEALVRRYHDKANSPPPEPISRPEIMFAAICVVLNALVAVFGIVLWRAQIINLRPNGSVLETVIDVAVLIVLMDFGMYVFHRAAHHPLLYPIIHLTHHLYENPRPLTLFVLNPFEVLGFGALLIVVIWFTQASQVAIVIYLAFNLIFGLVGHLGVEPAPDAWLKLPVIRAISTSTFHAEHHHDKAHNFGFYTVIWDRLFGTLSPEYAQDFGRANGVQTNPPNR